MERKIDILGFDTWMSQIIQSVHYLNNEKMDKAHDRLLKPIPENISYGKIEIKIEENVINTTSKRKIFRSFKYPFKRKEISN